MGEKLRNKDKAKTPKSPKASKHGLRPHEQREKDAAFKSADIPTKPVGDRKPPKK